MAMVSGCRALRRGVCGMLYRSGIGIPYRPAPVFDIMDRRYHFVRGNVCRSDLFLLPRSSFRGAGNMVTMTDQFPEIIYEDEDILAVNKPAGMIVHGVAGRRSTEPTLADLLSARYPEIKNVGDDPALRPGIVHRLDKDTSGVMLIARNQKSFAYLKSLFQNRDIIKTYAAAVAGVPSPSRGVIDRPIGIVTGTTKRSVRSEKMAKPAVTEYEVLKTAEATDGFGRMAPFSLLSVRPKTGRTHQIRVHLASTGHQIVGDPLYGPKKQPAWAGRLMLHASSIEFSDRSGRRLRFTAELPRVFTDVFSDVRMPGDVAS